MYNDDFPKLIVMIIKIILYNNEPIITIKVINRTQLIKNKVVYSLIIKYFIRTIYQGCMCVPSRGSLSCRCEQHPEKQLSSHASIRAFITADLRTVFTVFYN